jgi:dTMP kinase
LVIQRFDGVDPVFLWHLNEEAKRPDLAVILEADPDVIAERLEARGPRNRFQHMPGSSRTEVTFYRQVTEMLKEVVFPVLTVNCASRPPEQSAVIVASELVALLVPSEAVGR